MKIFRSLLLIVIFVLLIYSPNLSLASSISKENNNIKYIPDIVDGYPSIIIKNQEYDEYYMIVKLYGIYQVLQIDGYNISIKNRYLSLKNMVSIFKMLKNIRGEKHVNIDAEEYIRSIWVDHQSYHLDFNDLIWVLEGPKNISNNIVRYMFKSINLDNNVAFNITILLDIINEDIILDLGSLSIPVESKSVKIGIIVDRWNFKYSDDLINKLKDLYHDLAIKSVLSLKLDVILNSNLISSNENIYEIFDGEYKYMPVLDKEYVFNYNNIISGIIRIDNLLIKLIGKGYEVNGGIKELSILNIGIPKKNEFSLYILFNNYRYGKLIYDPIIKYGPEPFYVLFEAQQPKLEQDNKALRAAIKGGVEYQQYTQTVGQREHYKILDLSKYYISINSNIYLGIIFSVILFIIAFTLWATKMYFID